ncbi:MFS transporter [Nocardiopsis sp. ATB16-24]|uniref:MFS transporter n=1 Tax=Nocardiopsis sp. ATB16-24 TaxID=3019555 RepID=UPI002555F230|nr:MFS transporter [Nocardiopsis sp. ATB16-24]
MRLQARFWRLAFASGVSNLSDGLVSVVLPLVALQSTGSALAVAAVAAATRLPWLLFALPVGAVIDNVDRRALMVGAQIFRGVGLAVLAVSVVTGLVAVWQLVVLALLLGTAEVLYDSASQTMLPSVVPKDSLPAANSRLFGIEATANTFIGPPLGGLLVVLDSQTAIAAGAVAYLGAAVFVRSIPGDFRPRVRPETSSVEPVGPSVSGSRPSLSVAGTVVGIREGLRYLLADAVLRRLSILVGAVSFTMGAIGVILPVHVVEPGPMGLNEAGYGLLVASSGIGAVLASLTSERVLKRLPTVWCLRSAIIAVALMQFTLPSTQPVLVGLALAWGSFFVVLWNVVTVSYRQAAVPDHLLGRVNSAYRMCAWGFAPLGALAGGALAAATSTGVAFTAAGACTLLMVFVVWGIRGIAFPGRG